MQTIVLQPRGESGLEAVLNEAASRLSSGELVALPTETVYGLAADARNAEAVRKIFEVKGRPSDNPLIVHVATLEAAKELASEFPPLALKLAERFWPGPLTLVLPAAGGLADSVTCGLPTVAVRIPEHPLFLSVLGRCGFPLAAPSANLSGRPSPTTAQHVVDDLHGKIPLVLDGGPSAVGLESTVVDVTGEIPKILRLGGIEGASIEEIVGKVEIDLGSGERPSSPGQKYKHYAPRAELTVVFGEASAASKAVRERIAMARVAGKKIGVWAPAGLEELPADRIISHGPEPAATLYAALRSFDAAGMEAIVAVGLPENGLGRTANERLRRAASLVLELAD